MALSQHRRTNNAMRTLPIPSLSQSPCRGRGTQDLLVVLKGGARGNSISNALYEGHLAQAKANRKKDRGKKENLVPAVDGTLEVPRELLVSSILHKFIG